MKLPSDIFLTFCRSNVPRNIKGILHGKYFVKLFFFLLSFPPEDLSFGFYCKIFQFIVGRGLEIKADFPIRTLSPEKKSECQ